METYDVIIIGGGPGGYSAGIYASRYELKTLIIAKERGGLITKTHLVENYPGFPSLSGTELMKHIEEHVKANNVEIKDDIVESITKENNHFLVKTYSAEYKAKAVIVATGSEHRKLNVPGEKEYYGRGVSYCATCDGAFFKDKIIGVVGGSDSAAKEALLLSQYGKKVYIIYRREKIRAEPINARRVEENPKIEIIPNTNIVEIKGDEQKLTHVIFDKPYKGSKEFKLDGLFIDIGHIPQNDIVKPLNPELNEKGELVVDKYMKTSVPGLFGAGDNINFSFKQAIVSAAQGATAAYSAFEYLQKGN